MTTEELIHELEAIFAAADDPGGAMTRMELERELGLGEDAVRRRLHALAAAGRLETVKVRRTSPLSGATSPVIAYRIKGVTE